MAAEEVTAQFIENMEAVNGIMQDLAAEIDKMAKLSKTASGAKTNEIKQLGKSSSSFDALNDSVRNSTDEQEAYNKVINASNEVWKGMKTTVSQTASVIADFGRDALNSGEGFSMFRSMIEPVSDLLAGAGKVLGGVVGGFMKLGKDIPFVGGALETFGEGVSLAGEAVGKLAAEAFKFIANLTLDSVEQLWSMFEGAAGAGMLVTGGLHEMHNQAMALNLTTAEYTKLIQNQADNLAQFGGSVADGAKRLKEVALAAGDHNQRLRQLGISYEEQAEQTAEFMSSLQRTGQLRAMSDQQIADQSFEYMKTLRVISALTGKTAEQMKEDRNAALQNLAFQAELAKMDPAIRVEMEKMLSGMPEGMEQAMKESIIFGEVLTDTGAIASGTAPLIEQLANSVKNGEATFDDAFQGFRDNLKDQAPQLRENLNSLAAAGMAELLGRGNAVTGSINKFSASLLKQLAIAEGAVEDQVAKTAGVDVGDSVENIVSMMDTQRELMHTILLEAQERLPAVSDILKGLTENISEVFTVAKETLGAGGEYDLGKIGSDVMGTVGKTMNTFTNLAKSAMATVETAMTATTNMIASIRNSGTFQFLFGQDEATRIENVYSGQHTEFGMSASDGGFARPTGPTDPEMAKQMRQEQVDARVTYLEQQLAEAKAKVAEGPSVTGFLGEVLSGSSAGEDVTRLEKHLAEMVELQKQMVKKQNEANQHFDGMR